MSLTASGSIFKLFLEADKKARHIERAYEDDTTTLAKRMIRAREENSFLLAAVVGPLGAGKSVYAILSAWQYLKHYGLASRYKEQGTRRVIERYITFFASDKDKTHTLTYLVRHGNKNIGMVSKLDTLESILRSASINSRWPVVIWDDAGVFGSAYRFFTNKKFVMKMSALFQLARRRTYALIITTPALEFVLAAARNIPETTVVLVSRVGERTSIAKGYKIYYLPSGRKYIKKEFEDRFNRYLPDSVYNVYAQMTDAYVDAALALEDVDKTVAIEGEEGTINLDEYEITILEVLAKARGWLTARAIGTILGVSESSAKMHVTRLIDHGFVESRHARGYRITEAGIRLLGRLGRKN